MYTGSQGWIIKTIFLPIIYLFFCLDLIYLTFGIIMSLFVIFHTGISFIHIFRFFLWTATSVETNIFKQNVHFLWVFLMWSHSFILSAHTYVYPDVLVFLLLKDVRSLFTNSAISVFHILYMSINMFIIGIFVCDFFYRSYLTTFLVSFHFALLVSWFCLQASQYSHPLECCQVSLLSQNF